MKKPHEDGPAPSEESRNRCSGAGFFVRVWVGAYISQCGKNFCVVKNRAAQHNDRVIFKMENRRFLMPERFEA